MCMATGNKSGLIGLIERLQARQKDAVPKQTPAVTPGDTAGPMPIAAQRALRR